MKREMLAEIRKKIQPKWKLAIWDAYMLDPWMITFLTKERLRNYSSDALRMADRVSWEDYLSIRNDLVKYYHLLLDRYGMPKEQWEISTYNMLKRFMVGRIQYFQYLAKRENYQGRCIEPAAEDMHNCEMAQIFACLPQQPKIAQNLRELDVNYEYDQMHMVNWFSGQLSLGRGKYSRSQPNHSAKKTYERLKNPYSLLWIAAALGEDLDQVRAARKKMDEYVSWTAKSCAVRILFPFERILELAMETRSTEMEINTFLDL